MDKVGCGVHLLHLIVQGGRGEGGGVLGRGDARPKVAEAHDKLVDEDGGGDGPVAGTRKLDAAGDQGKGKEALHCGGLLGVCPHVHRNAYLHGLHVVEPQRGEVEQVSGLQNHLQGGDVFQGGKPNDVARQVADVHLALGVARVQKGVRR